MDKLEGFRGKPKRRRREKVRSRHHQLFVFLFSAEVLREGVSIRMITQILNNDPKGAFVEIAETNADGSPHPSSGPFQIEVVDPAPALTTVAAGSPDNTTPTRIVANGSGVGSVTVNVTDTSNGAKGSAVLGIVAPPPPPPPPPPVPTLTVSFAPGT